MHRTGESILLLYVLDNNTFICYQFDYNIILLIFFDILFIRFLIIILFNLMKYKIKQYLNKDCLIMKYLNNMKYKDIIHFYEPLYTIHHQLNIKV